MAAAVLGVALAQGPAGTNRNKAGADAGASDSATSAVAGGEVFSKHCAACHGPTGAGSAIAPSLHGVTNLALVKNRIREGKGIMPSFKSVLTTAQVDAAANFVVTQLGPRPTAAPPPVKKPAPAVSAPSEGAKLFSEHCAVCHGPKGKGSKIAPSLQAATNPNLVKQMMREGPSIMPSFTNILSPAQINETADYVATKLATLRLKGGTLSEGGKLFRINCSPCHRTAVRGGALIFTKGIAPSLVGLNAATIVGAVRTGPGPMPVFPASVLDDQQLASVVKYVQFMSEPPHPGGFPMHFYGPVVEGFAAFLALVALALIGAWIERKGAG